MRKTFSSLLFIFFVAVTFFSFSFAEEEQKPNPTPKSVTAIEVKGNKAISSNTIISKMKTRIGDPYQETVISDDLKRLYLLGYFSDIKIDSEDYKGGLKVIVTVAERPIISKINFTGINRITMKDEKLKDLLKSKETQYLDYPNLAEDVKTLAKMYEKMGFSQAAIEYKVNINKETNKAEVTFNVAEGGKVRIKDINIAGNKNFTSNRIRKLLKTKSAWFFNAGVLKEDVLKEDMERIKAFYRKNGFADISVSYEVKPDPLKKFLLHIIITVNEGRKYLVGNVTLQGNKDISEKLLLSSLKNCLPGKVYDEDALKEDVAAIQSVYFDRGYISCQVLDATSVNSATGRVDINYSIIENQVSYVDKIKIRGNVKTRDLVIRRELRIRPGDKFDGEKLRRSKERLQNLGFFDDISYDTEETKEPDKKNLIVDVKETKTGSFSFGGGYSTVDSLVGFFEIEQKNFDWKNWPYFTGAGQNLKFRASFGTITHEFELSFTEPWLFDYPISFGFDAYNREHKRDTDVGYGYDEKVTGGDLRLGKELSEYLRGDLVYRLDQIDISNVDTAVTSSTLLNEVGTNIISSITPSITFDSRDNVFDPRKGNLFTSSVEFAGGALMGDKNFWKYMGRYSHYFPLPRGSTLEVRGRLGLADAYGDSSNVPIYERFFAGGAYTIRGYEERSLGPVDPATSDPLGGNALLIGNIEYTYPLFSFLKVAAFYDVGNVWDKIGDLGSNKNANDVINSGGFKSGFGLGVRIKTPMGPIMLDYGIPMDKASGKTSKDKGGRIHFSASHGF
ncbi:MAG: outer membrane protein assembly factor BamA [Candidatus Omnitrophota bacterium]|jgi:outer membrane protein insertion porin family